MRKYNVDDIHALLRALDARLQRTIEITIVGGAAIGLVYDGAHTTTDIDLTPTSDEAFWTAVRDVTATLEPPYRLLRSPSTKRPTTGNVAGRRCPFRE